MQKLIILASLAICCCLAAPTTERSIAEKEKELPQKGLLIDPIPDTEVEDQHEDEKAKPQQTTGVILLHREKRENAEEQQEPTKFLGIQNLRGELSPEETAEHDKDHAEHEKDHAEHEVEEENRPKRENIEENEKESKPAPTKFLGIQNLRGELSPEEQTEHKEDETDNLSEEEKRLKREHTETKEDETKPATTQFSTIQNLRGELSPEEVSELKKEHAQHQAEEEQRPKRTTTEEKNEETKSDAIPQVEPKEQSPEEDIEQKEAHAHQQVVDATRPKRGSTEVNEDEKKPATTQLIGIQNLRGELSPEEQTQHKEDEAHHHVEEDEKRPKREHADAATPATTSDEAAIPQTLPAQLPHGELTKEQKRQEAAHLLLTNVNGARRRRDIPVPLVPKHQHNEPEGKPAETPEEKPAPAHDYDTLQVEDLSDGTPPTLKVEHATASTTPKPSSTTSQHPLIRIHPVSVAELFNRPKQQPAASNEKSEA